jgi:O-antigen/teichoic acid export membrane protein
VSAFSGLLSKFYGEPELVPVLIALATGFIVAGFRTVPDSLLQKELRFRQLALFEALQAVLVALTTIALAMLGFRYWTLVGGYLLGGILAAGLALSIRPVSFRWPRFGELRKALRFGTDLVISRLAWFAYSNADFLIAGRLLGKTALGNYTFAWSIASVPVGKISQLLIKVSPAYFSAVQKENSSLRRYLLSVTEGLALLTFPAALALAIVTDDFVMLLMGEKWAGAVVPLRLLAIYASLRSIAVLLPPILTVIGDTKFNVRNSIAAAVVLPIAFIIGARVGGTAGIAAAWMVAHPLVLARLYQRTFEKIELRAVEYIKALRPAMVGSFWMIVVLLLVRWLEGTRGPLALRFGVECAAGAITYCAVIFLLYRDRLIAFRAIARGGK